MPKEKFEELIKDPCNITEGYKRSYMHSASQLRFRDMIKEGLVSETLLENIIRAAAIYKEENGQLSIVQLNDQYAAATGITANEEDMKHFTERLDDREVQKLNVLLEKANAHPLGGSEGPIRFCKSDGSVAELNMRVFLLYSFDNHRIYLSTMG